MKKSKTIAVYCGVPEFAIIKFGGKKETSRKLKKLAVIEYNRIMKKEKKTEL
jgi:hypothetical protein